MKGNVTLRSYLPGRTTNAAKNVDKQDQIRKMKKQIMKNIPDILTLESETMKTESDDFNFSRKQ